jgi:leucyl aminopeptidase
MPVEITAEPLPNARLVHAVAKGALDGAGLPPATLAWAKANGFDGGAGEVLLVPGETAPWARRCWALAMGQVVLRRWSPASWRAVCRRVTGPLQKRPDRPALACLGLAMGGYRFTRYGTRSHQHAGQRHGAG